MAISPRRRALARVALKILALKILVPALLVHGAWLSACSPERADEHQAHKPVERCERAGQRCKLADNKLGVCGASASPGAWTCHPQH